MRLSVRSRSGHPCLRYLPVEHACAYFDWRALSQHYILTFFFDNVFWLFSRHLDLFLKVPDEKKKTLLILWLIWHLENWCFFGDTCPGTDYFYVSISLWNTTRKSKTIYILFLFFPRSRVCSCFIIIEVFEAWCVFADRPSWQCLQIYVYFQHVLAPRFGDEGWRYLISCRASGLTLLLSSDVKTAVLAVTEKCWNDFWMR